jgi:hypothetical protein
MDLLKNTLTELMALFVDDGSFVLTVIAWVLGGVVCLRGGLVDPGFEAALLFLGISVILLENVERTARTRGFRSGPR